MVLHFSKCNGANMESAITVKGQATIPKAIREHLALKPGDRVKFFVHPRERGSFAEAFRCCFARHRQVPAQATGEDRGNDKRGR